MKLGWVLLVPWQVVIISTGPGPDIFSGMHMQIPCASGQAGLTLVNTVTKILQGKSLS
jgi:hypothetical protein